MNYLDFARKVIKEENRPLTSKEIWEIGKNKGYDKELKSVGKTPWCTIGAQLYVDIKRNEEKTIFDKISKPTRFFLKNMDVVNIKQEKIEQKKIDNREENYDERSLHKYLTYFVYSYKEQNIYTKTIYHEKTTKKDNYTKWLHPDMVGVEQIDFSESNVVEFTNIKPKLFSYELKKHLNHSNLRESFFQTVSNSSWANEAYLVSPDIDDEDTDFMKELGRLTSSFGIGIIKLDLNNPAESEILFPAKEREYLNTETMIKLSEQNTDFKNFITRVNNDYKNGEIVESFYDEIPKIEDICDKKGLMKSKKI